MSTSARRATAPSVVRWSDVPDHLRHRGLRWTRQRRAIVDALATASGHVSAAELVERCRADDPSTTPSTVYRTLDVLEELGLVRHGHGLDGREEFHVRPGGEHGHLYCSTCGGRWEIADAHAREVVDAFASADGFAVDLSHMTVVGTCRSCGAARDA
jgi:Fur family transcriptional regulator, ferric uptake regulator